MARLRGRSRRGRKGVFPPRPNDPTKHIPEMRVHFPEFAFRVGPNRMVTWTGDLQPNPASPSYRIRVVYGLRGPPKVWVLSPQLRSDAPHRYPDGRLCLFWPMKWRWKDTESISLTVVGWTALWLEYYEIWQILGEWHGPSSHDEFPEEPEEENVA